MKYITLIAFLLIGLCSCSNDDEDYGLVDKNLFITDTLETVSKMNYKQQINLKYQLHASLKNFSFTCDANQPLTLRVNDKVVSLKEKIQLEGNVININFENIERKGNLILKVNLSNTDGSLPIEFTKTITNLGVDFSVPEYVEKHLYYTTTSVPGLVSNGTAYTWSLEYPFVITSEWDDEYTFMTNDASLYVFDYHKFDDEIVPMEKNQLGETNKWRQVSKGLHSISKCKKLGGLLGGATQEEFQRVAGSSEEYQFRFRNSAGIEKTTRIKYVYTNTRN